MHINIIIGYTGHSALLLLATVSVMRYCITPKRFVSNIEISLKTYYTRRNMKHCAGLLRKAMRSG